ncbi:hypothetical protein TcWFU_002368 [Taenia crassiceps]|uniref:Secreted protein n=1 Tax=Taenia crassiceps TaxID=6207 RepID=A0ABR4Q259_9CEST
MQTSAIVFSIYVVSVIRVGTFTTIITIVLVMPKCRTFSSPKRCTTRISPFNESSHRNQFAFDATASAQAKSATTPSADHTRDCNVGFQRHETTPNIVLVHNPLPLISEQSRLNMQYGTKYVAVKASSLLASRRTMSLSCSLASCTLMAALPP